MSSNLFIVSLRDSRSQDLSCDVPVMSFTLERVRTPAPPSWTSSSTLPAMETCFPPQNLRPSTAAPHKEPRLAVSPSPKPVMQSYNTVSKSYSSYMLNLSVVVWTGGVAEPAHISSPPARWDWAADVAGSDEWSHGGDWRAAHTRTAAERWGVCSEST